MLRLNKNFFFIKKWRIRKLKKLYINIKDFKLFCGQCYKLQKITGRGTVFEAHLSNVLNEQSVVTSGPSRAEQ